MDLLDLKSLSSLDCIFIQNVGEGRWGDRRPMETLVFIDSGVEDYEILRDGVLPGAITFVLNAEDDGILQISKALDIYRDVRSIHIVSHGNPGTLYLGSSQLTLNTIETYYPSLQKWADALAANAQILLYGCRVAAGVDGLTFIQQLHEALGVAIAASTTPVGHASQGGNWHLDVTTEPMEVSLSFTSQALEAFTGVLVGEVIFSINLGSNNIQTSNFGNNSFLITNTGTLAITSVEIDVTGALYPDSVFDPEGEAGDTSSKGLTINTEGGTGFTSSSYVGLGGTSGYEGLILNFSDFNPGETLGFSIDMDPNSIAGSSKSTLDAGSDPGWDVGGVSGAELIGSMITVTFEDGSTATGQLMSDGTLAGGQALISQASPNLSVSLTVNGLAAGGVGNYDSNGPSVMVNGPAGQTARVVLTKGFIQPVTNLFDEPYASQLDAQLDALAAQSFPANNAVEFQIIDVLLTGEDQDISSLFNFAGVAAYDFAGEDQLPLGFVASIIDPTNQNLPLGPVTDPIYLAYEDTTGPSATITAADVNAYQDGLTTYSFTVSYFDGSGINEASLGNDDVIVTGPNGYTTNATFESSVVESNGAVTATYTITPPGGSWSTDDDGVYTIALQSGSVTDGSADGISPVETTFSADLTSAPPPLTVRIEAEDYKAGGQGVGYFDDTAGNAGGAYRTDDVDIQATSADGGGFNIGWTKSGEWLAYDVNVAQTGTYDIVLRVATPKSDTKTLKVTIGGQSYNATFSNTGGWQTYADAVVSGVNLTAGLQPMRVDFLSDNFNFNYIELRPAAAVTNTAPTTTGISDITVVEGAADTVLDLYSVFEDLETADANLFYTVEGNTNPTLFSSITVDNMTGQLILDYLPTGTGISEVTVRATDPEGAFIDTTFTVTVNASTGNTAPTTTGIADVTVSENAPNTEIDLYAAFDDAETADSGLFYSVVGNTNAALFTATTIDATTGTLILDYPAIGTGIADLTVRATDPEGAFVDTTFTVTVNAPVVSGQPIRIEAEDYKAGGQGVGYFDDTAGNMGGAYRTDDVDIQSTSADGGGFNIGWTKVGEWLAYDVMIPESGVYDIALRVATPKSDTKTLKVTIGGQSYNATFTNTGGWQTYADAVITGVNLTAGTQELRVDYLSDNFNFNYIELRPTDPDPNTAPTTIGIADIAVLEGATDTVIDLYPVFADAETADANLAYTVEGNTNSSLFEVGGVSIDPTTGQLTLNYAATGTGTADITVRATDPEGAFVDTTFTVTVSRPTADESAPAATFSAPTLTVSDSMYTYFDVIYTDPAGVDLSTLGASDLSVLSTNGGFPLTTILVGFEDDGDNTSVTATYAIKSPGDRWDDVDNGTYTVSLVAGEVADTLGNITSTNTAMGDLSVNITPGSAPLDFTNYTFVDADGNKPEQVLINAVSGDLAGTTFVFDATAAGGLIPHFHAMGNPQFITQHNGADNGEQINFTMARQDGEAFSLSGFSYTSGAHMPNGDRANGSFTVIGTTAEGQTVSQTFGPAHAPGVFQVATLTDAAWQNVVSVQFLGDRLTTQTTPDGNLVLTQSLNLDNIIVDAAVVTFPDPIRIEAEDYKAGGQNVGYFDTTTGNNGGAYRTDDVDIQSTGDIGGGFNIGWTAVGEWLVYDVTIPASGVYDIALRVATPKADTKTLQVTIGGQTYNAAFSNTGGWQTYQDVVISGVTLAAGTQELRVDYLSDNFNFNYIELRPAGPVVNQAPTTSGIADITVIEGTDASVVSLYDAFEDDFDLDSELIYSIQGNTNSALFETGGISIDPLTGELTLDYIAAGTGSADITVRATDTEGLFTDTTFTASVVESSSNTAPTTSGLANITVDEGAANTVVDLYPAFADNESTDAELAYTVQNNTNSALFTEVSIDPATGQLILDYADTGTGSADLTIRATDPQGAFVDTTFTVTVNPNSNQLIRIQAEDYREGGQGVAYFDDTPGNKYGQYRNDDVDIEVSGDVGGGFNVGAIKPGEWLTYEINLSEPGLFKVVARVATAQNDTKTIKATIGGIANTVTFTNTGGWQTYQDVIIIPEVSLGAGTHVLRFDTTSSSFNLNYLDLVSLIDVTPPTASMPPVASDITIANGSKGNYTLTINYSDNVAIDPETLDGREIVINGPNGFNTSPVLVGITQNANGSAIKATYEVAPPGGTWDFADEGDYFVELLSNKVTDTSGLPVAGAVLGSFPVTIEEQDHFLHVEIEAPAWVIDYDGDGDEVLPLDGRESHTHEFGAFLTGWTWSHGDTIIGTGETITTTLGVGHQNITLTIEDNKQQTLADSVFINVYPLNAVGGVLTEYYTTGGQPFSTLLDTLPAAPSFVEVQFDLSIDETNNTLGDSPFTGDVIAVLTGDFAVDVSGTYDFAVIGGVDSRLYINGSLITVPLALTAGTNYDLEVRVARAASETVPIEVQATLDGGATTVFTPTSLTHDQSTLAPFINRMPAQGSEFGGEVITIEGLGFFEGEAANQVSVQWGDTTISGADLTITQGQIKFLAPPGTGTVTVTVTTPNGTSAPGSYSYNPSVVPIDFTDPVAVATVGAPTQAAWGPDGRLYIASVIGTVTALEFDDNYNVLTTQSIAGVSGTAASNILGIAFNPYDSEPKIYIAHSQLFPGEDSAYVGNISILEGPNFDTVTPLVTGLPVSNHDHGINGMAFDNNGDLLVAVGGNTNAGIESDKMGWLPESPLSGAILKVHVTDPDFNGNVTYLERGTGIEKPLQIDGNTVDVAPGVDVTVYAPGHRNPYDIVYTTKGLLYGTDNGPNAAFGPASTSATTQTVDGVGASDELNLLIEGNYYGHPNRNRGFYDDRENVYYSPDALEIPGVYDSPLATLGSSSNGIDEYRSMAFKGQMYGDLLIQKWNGQLTWANLNATGDAVVDSSGNVITGNLPKLVTSAQGNHVGSGGDVANGLDVLLGPGGAIVGINYSDNAVTVSLPDDISVTATSMVAYDIFPWRSPATVGGREFIIGGSGFGNLSNTSVQFGDLTAEITEVSANRIYGIIPQDPTPTNELLDITVAVDTEVSVIPDAFQYLSV